MKTHHKYKYLVHRILKENKAARNSDKDLMEAVVGELDPELLPIIRKLFNSPNLPSWDSITRCRRFWQERDEDCMSDLQVARGRAKRELEYAEEFGHGGK